MRYTFEFAALYTHSQDKAVTKKAARKGFTLIELLIVTVIIGVLSGMFMLSSTKSVTSAEAMKIVAGLKSISNALNMWYLDNMDLVDQIDVSNNDAKKALESFMLDGTYNGYSRSSVKKYLQDGVVNLKAPPHTAGDYAIGIRTDGWFITYQLPSNEGEVNDALAARAAELGLTDSTWEDTYNGKEDIVAMRVR